MPMLIRCLFWPADPGIEAEAYEDHGLFVSYDTNKRARDRFISPLPTRRKLKRRNASLALVPGAVHGRTASHGLPSGIIFDS